MTKTIPTVMNEPRPFQLALYVLSFLAPRDLLHAAQTCRYWRILCEDNLLWREKCREAGLDECQVPVRPGQSLVATTVYCYIDF